MNKGHEKELSYEDHLARNIPRKHPMSRDYEKPVSEEVDRGTKYRKKIKGVYVDIYDVLIAFEITCPALQHGIKKLLMKGERGHKDLLTDLREAEHSIKRAIEIEEER